MKRDDCLTKKSIRTDLTFSEPTGDDQQYEFVRLTGLVRSYAWHVLKTYGTRRSVVVDGQRVEVIVGQASSTKCRRKRPYRYDQAVLHALKRLWAFSNGLCGKRLQVFIIRTFADWNEAEPGFVEGDLVAHDGGIAYGDYAQTMDLTDIATT